MFRAIEHNGMERFNKSYKCKKKLKTPAKVININKSYKHKQKSQT